MTLTQILKESGLQLWHGKIQVPEWCDKIKFDVGLSHDAPQSRRWIEHDPNLLVIGFEPVNHNRSEILRNFSNNPNYAFNVNLRRQLVVLPLALSDVNALMKRHMYVTALDTGCSSLFEPEQFEVSSLQECFVTSLHSVLDFFPFDQMPYIDHLKTDAQGSDFDIIKSAGSYIDRFLAVTCEAESKQYKMSNNGNGVVHSFLVAKGFSSFSPSVFKDFRVRILTDDPTYLNLRALRNLNRSNLFIYQQG